MDLLILLLGMVIAGAVGYVTGVQRTKRTIERKLLKVLEKHRKEIE